jgi:hypothetical protein
LYAPAPCATSTACFASPLDAPVPGNGFIYLWVEKSPDRYSVVYVGMAGGTLKARCDQHTGGFRSSAPGKAHPLRIRTGLDAGCEYLVYVHKGGIGTVLGEEHVPLTAVEEFALIRKFAPSWNKPVST